MKIQDIFQQDIGRNIETVIKADDRANIWQEVNEYVITKEIAKKISHFFEEYTNYQSVNGVWISGFFGSGKSHLLKILSYVLENMDYDGERLGEQFAQKVEDNPMLKGNILRATRIPSESILFNIDQHAQITSKQDADAILSVFYKVFYEHLGYFGAQRHVAEFERWVDGEGHYTQFVQQFGALYGKSWEVGRRTYFAPKIKDAIAQVLAKLNNDQPEKYKDIIGQLRKDDAISVLDFCQKVKNHLDTKAVSFRLNFFVDEVGQYISEHTKLMLNLQTIAETLATVCKGRAWILVTSQEDLEAVIGDNHAVQTDDFSKIQGRFKIRIPLTSSNVDEVIEKRLLAKKVDAAKDLQKLYEQHQSNLKTLLSFSESSVFLKGFEGGKDFVNKYPFIPYQFDLFQQSIKALSKHNAFQGRHASVGERSMLGVFQEVVKNLGTAPTNTFVSFDKLYEGIRSTVKSQMQNQILLAEQNLKSHPFVISVLKALFLVKYYGQFKTTKRNVGILLLNDLNLDIKAHDKKVEEALLLLEQQTYIERNGDGYTFLTDEEKDIEQEIKTTELDSDKIPTFLSEVIFDDIISSNRIKYLENKQDYEFTRKLDGTIFGREKELTVEIITPNYHEYERANFKAKSMGFNNLVYLFLGNDATLMTDVRLYLRTEKYIKQNQRTSSGESTRRILYDKAQQNRQRRQNILLTLKKLLSESRAYLNGSDLEIGTVADGKTKVSKAFQYLVELAYPSLKMVGNIAWSEDTIRQIMSSPANDLFGGDESTISEAEKNILNFIQRRKKQSERSHLSDIREQFSKKPYGWSVHAIWSLTARLFRRGKVEARADSQVLEDRDFIAAIFNTRLHANTIITPQVEFDHRVVKKLKILYRDAFDDTLNVTEAKEVAKAFKQKAKERQQDIRELLTFAGEYPFLKELSPLHDLLEALAQKDYAALITDIKQYEDVLMDAKEDVLTPIEEFWSGSQKKIFDNIRQFINGNQSNFEYLEGDDLGKLQQIYQDPKPYQGTTMKQAKSLIEKLRKEVLTQIETERTKVKERITNAMVEIQQSYGFQETSTVQQQQLFAPFEELKQRTDQQKFIGNIQSYALRTDEFTIKQLNLLKSFLVPKDGTVAEPKTEFIARNNIKVPYGKKTISNANEVATYTDELKAEMLRHIEQNRIIRL